MSEQSMNFMSKINTQLNEGHFDNEITLPFMSRDTIRLMIQKKMDVKIETGSTPFLSEREVEDAVKSAKLLAAETAAIFLEMGLLERAEEGIQVSDHGKTLIKTVK